MHRRNFIRNGSFAGLSLAFLSCTMKRPEGVDNFSFSLSETTIDAIQAKMKSGELTAERITQLYLDRINAIDKNGPAINSVIELNPDAIAIAKGLDEERKNGKLRGPMHGIPVLIKDNIDTADKMLTTAGALALADNHAKKDAFIVQKLRTAGAVILGKTNLSEWANFRSSRSSSGWSSRGGQTHSPYVTDRSPCGSSSGSAVAVAANLCVVAVGTETDGSIACPASMNGVVGIKPTVGLVSRSGIIPISKTQDTAGPFGRTVKDAAILLSAITGIDDADAVTIESKKEMFEREKLSSTFPPPKNIAAQDKPDYTRFLDPNGLKGKRIGIEKTLLKKHEGIDALLKKALDQLTAAEATIIEVEFMNENSKVSGAEFTVLEYEFKDGVNKYLAGANSKMESLQDVINYNKQNEAKAMPYFKQELLDSSEAKGDLNSKEYTDALAKSTSMRQTITNLMQSQKLDALCGPATGTSWCIDPVNGDSWTGYGAYGPAAVAGFPSITVPMGFLHDLPVGLSFFAGAYQEPKLIAMGYAYEQVSKNRKAPEFKDKIE